MKRRTLLALSALPFVLAGCGGGGGPKAQVGSISGIVYDSLQADLPVEGATISIGTATGTTTVRAAASATKQVGSFQLTNVPLGASTAVITVPGQPAQTLAFQPPIAAGANSALTLYLNIGQVRGRVLDEAGQPVRNAIVVVNTALRSATAFTGADGSFLVELVPDGPAELTAGFGSKLASKNLNIAFGLNEAGDLTLAPDANPNPPAAIKTIYGKVTSAVDNSAISGAPVLLLRGGVQLETINTDASGEYYFAVPAGSYTVQAVPSGFVTGESPANLANPNTPLAINFSLAPR